MAVNEPLLLNIQLLNLLQTLQDDTTAQALPFAGKTRIA